MVQTLILKALIDKAVKAQINPYVLKQASFFTPGAKSRNNH